MSSTAPPVLDKDADQFRDEVVEGLQSNVGWQPADPAADQTSAALIGVFARFCEVFTDRLNRAPNKNFLAFLDLLGTSLLPPQPARVPLTFTLNAGSTVDAVVPAGTQVAAPPAPGGKDPVIFETERELSVVAAKLQALFSADGAADLLADHSALLTNPLDEGAAVFSSNRINEHVLYIGHELLGLENISEARIEVDAQAADASGAVRPFDHRRLIWELWDGALWRPFGVGLLDLGNPPLKFPAAAGLRPSAPQTIGGITNSWMRCRWREGAILADSEATLPTWRLINVGAVVQSQGLRPDAVFMNGQVIDSMRPFYSFGQQPGLGDALYIASRDAFSRPGASVVLSLPVVNPTGLSAGGSAVPPVQTFDDLQLWWEVWNGTAWSVLGTSSPEQEPTESFSDGTRAFTVNFSRVSRLVSMRLPDGTDPALTAKPTEINGVTSFWIRVRIVAGNYGHDARYVDDPDHPGQLKFEPATFAPPLIESLSIGYSATVPPTQADLVSYNSLQFENLRPALAQGLRVMPFRPLPDQPPSLYMAFTVPSGRAAFPNRAISLYHGVRPVVYGEAAPLAPRKSTKVVAPGTSAVTAAHTFIFTNTGNEPATYELRVFGGRWLESFQSHQVNLPPGLSTDVTITAIVPPAAEIPAGTVSDVGALLVSSGTRAYAAIIETRITEVALPPRSLRWEYWNGSTWSKLSVRDDTGELTRSGIVEFLGPSDIARVSLFGVDAWWVRVTLINGDGEGPVLRAMLPNTTIGSQAITVRDEFLGSSDATGNQKFRTTRAPVLASPQLEVREAAPLTGAELAALQAAHGALDVTRADPNGSGAVWVRWLEVPDLYASGPQDRHYVLDHVTGEVRFGDGAQGRIPPRGSGNIQMARYQIGGGRAGNVAAGSIVQMKTTVPLIEAVVNPEAAQGGVETESFAALTDRAPRQLRHSNRAVAANDYEDLARLASPEVARTKCVPLRRLQGNDPLGNVPIPGAVSVIVVPDSTDSKPQPTVELLTRVEKYLQAHQAATAEIHAVGPLYVRVDVTVEAALENPDGATLVEEAIRVALDAFLHPLTGGRSGTGWDFGREPHFSDLQAVVGAIAGVDHIRRLGLTQTEEIEGARATGRFLIYSGTHRIDLAFVGAQ